MPWGVWLRSPVDWDWAKKQRLDLEIRAGRGVEPLLSAGPVRLSMTAADNGAPTPDGVWPGHGGHSPADPSRYTGTRLASLPAPRSVQRPRRSRSGLATGRGGGDRGIEGHLVGATAGEGDPVCPDFLRRRGGRRPSFGKKSDSTEPTNLGQGGNQHVGKIRETLMRDSLDGAVRIFPSTINARLNSAPPPYMPPTVPKWRGN